MRQLNTGEVRLERLQPSHPDRTSLKLVYMSDQSELDRKYLLSHDSFNCPFCNRRSVVYEVVDNFLFDWSEERKCYGYIIKCSGCGNRSFHLSYYNWICSYGNGRYLNPFRSEPQNFPDEEEYQIEHLDKYFFYHHPTSFFTIDDRIPKIIRELIAEADGCRKMNWLIGASGQLRKVIYKFLKDQNVPHVKDDKGGSLSYEEQIKWLKNKHTLVAGEYFDALSNIQDMVSEELHEDKDWEPWTREEFDYLIATVKAVLHEIYVLPEERKGMLTRVLQLGVGKKVK